MKKTSALENIFTFRDFQKSLKKTPIGFFCMMNKFYEPEKNLKKTWNFDTRFWERDKSVEMNAQGPFPIFRSKKKSKNKLPHCGN